MSDEVEVHDHFGAKDDVPVVDDQETLVRVCQNTHVLGYSSSALSRKSPEIAGWCKNCVCTFPFLVRR